MSTLKLEVLTPEKRCLSVETQSVNLEGSGGRLGILPDHTALIAKLDFGILEYAAPSGMEHLLCGQGYVEVNDNLVTVLVRSAERTEEIDVERAKKAVDRAKSRMHSKDKDVDLIRAQAALHRALHRLKYVKKI